MTTQTTARDTERPLKQCGCGLAYSAEAWEALPTVGVQEIPAGPTWIAYALVMKNCHCTSTLAIEVFT